MKTTIRHIGFGSLDKSIQGEWTLTGTAYLSDGRVIEHRCTCGNIEKRSEESVIKVCKDRITDYFDRVASGEL